MQIRTGIHEDEDGVQLVALLVEVDEYDDDDPVTIVMPAAVAREVAFGLVEQADKLDPPGWGGASHE